MGVKKSIQCCLATILVFCIDVSNTQQASPLLGQGLPPLNTTDVFLSAWLDMLLDVNDKDFRHESIIAFYITWQDSTAAATIANNAVGLNNDTARICGRPCSTFVNVRSVCCDDVYLPSFVFRNAYAFDQDREVGDQIRVQGDVVTWEIRVHGTYYSPMSQAQFPFDRFEISVELRFIDTSDLVPGHPGVKVHNSSSGNEIFMASNTAFDSTNGWRAYYTRWKVLRVDNRKWFGLRAPAAIPSHPDDPAAVESLQNGSPYPTEEKLDMILLLIGVHRRLQPWFIAVFAPLFSVPILAITVFFIPVEEIYQRLELIATLLLTLTAIQFVLNDYITVKNDFEWVSPPQAITIYTALLLWELASAAIISYLTASWPTKAPEYQNRMKAVGLTYMFSKLRKSVAYCAWFLWKAICSLFRRMSWVSCKRKQKTQADLSETPVLPGQVQIENEPKEVYVDAEKKENSFLPETGQESQRDAAPAACPPTDQLSRHEKFNIAAFWVDLLLFAIAFSAYIWFCRIEMTRGLNIQPFSATLEDWEDTPFIDSVDGSGATPLDDIYKYCEFGYKSVGILYYCPDYGKNCLRHSGGIPEFVPALPASDPQARFGNCSVIPKYPYLDSLIDI